MITDNTSLGIVMSVWAVHDDYDFQNLENYISATQLLKPLKMIIMGARNTTPQQMDVADFVSRALGTAIHSSVEKAWSPGHLEVNLKKLGYPPAVIERVKVNPTAEELTPDTIPIYIEQRAFKTIEGFNVGGKFDMIAEGILHDIKSTSAYSWVFGGRDDEHKLQGSLYWWLNPDKVTEGFIRITYLFTDWQKMMAKQKPTYPQSRIQQKDIILMTPPETEQWVRGKLQAMKRMWNVPEEQLPRCTDEELWRSDAVFKYYKDPTKTSGKSTKNFDDMAEAYAFMASQGNVGTVITFPGEVKRCGYCNGYDVCKQRREYFPDPDIPGIPAIS